MAKISNLHEVLASEDVGTAGGGDEDVASVNAILDGGHLRGFKMLKLVRAKITSNFDSTLNQL